MAKRSPTIPDWQRLVSAFGKARALFHGRGICGNSEKLDAAPLPRSDCPSERLLSGMLCVSHNFCPLHVDVWHHMDDLDRCPLVHCIMIVSETVQKSQRAIPHAIDVCLYQINLSWSTYCCRSLALGQFNVHFSLHIQWLFTCPQQIVLSFLWC
jgi:hypothetical protein